MSNYTSDAIPVPDVQSPQRNTLYAVMRQESSPTAIYDYWIYENTTGWQRLDRGERGLSAYEVYLTTVGQSETPMTEEEWLESLKGTDGADGKDGKDGTDGADAVNPFKGWFADSSSLPSSPSAGDFAYVKGATADDPVAIYECVTAGTWVDSGREFNPENNQEFESGENLNEVNIVDDFETGGSSNVLSAEQGKNLKNNILGYDTTVVDRENNILPAANVGYKISSGPSDGDLTAVALTFNNVENSSHSINVTDYRGSRLLIKGSAFYYTYAYLVKKAFSTSLSGSTFEQLIEGDYFSSAHFDEDNNFKKISIPNNEERYIEIPEDAIRLYLSKYVIESTPNRSPQYVYVETTTHTNGEVDGLKESCSKLEEVTESLDETVFGTFQEIETDGLGIAVEKLHWSVDRNTFFRRTGGTQTAYVIDVQGYEQVIIAKGVYSTRFCIAKDNFDINGTGNITAPNFNSTYRATGCDGYTPNDESIYRMKYSDGSTPLVITLSDNAKWLIIVKKFGSDTIYTPESVTLKKHAKTGGLVDAINTNTNAVASNTLISLTQGYLDEAGNHVDSSKFVMTSAIPMSRGFSLELHEPYRVHGAYLFDNNGNLVNPREYYNSIDNPNNGTIRYSWANILPQFNIRLRIGTSAENGIVKCEDINSIVSRFIYLDDSRLHKMIPTNDYGAADVHGIARKRAKTILNVVWKPLENAFITANNTNYARKGQTMHGVPYSEAAEYTKYVGNHISLRTFLTATMNKRSVVYTEHINSNGSTSKYGITYHGLTNLSGAYYGTVCSGFTTYVQALNNIHISGTQINSTVIANGDDTSEDRYYPLVNGTDPFDLIEPLDLIWYTDHITIVTDVLLDEDNNKKYIIWSEQNTPRTLSGAYTREQFKRRIIDTMKRDDRHAWRIYRYKGWEDGLPEPEDTPYIQRAFNDYTPQENLTIDDAITTFAGEYSAFPIGDPEDTDNNNKLYLNIHRNGTDGYTHLQIFNEDDEENTTPIAELGILSGDGYVAQSNIYAEDAADREDWIVYDLASYWYANQRNTIGKFKARVVRKESGSVTDSSGFTHFQMVDINFSVVRHSANIDCSFSSDEGNCYLIRQEKPDGMSLNMQYVYESDGGTKTLGWSSFGTYKYVKLFVRADYGTVVKRIDASSLEIS